MHFIIFYNKKIIFAKCNYEIYDKKFLVIIWCLKHWKFELKNIEKSIEIYIDHKNLKIFMIFKKLISRQMRWIEILVDYNIKIQYQIDVKNVKIDVLTRMFDFRFNENDDRKRYREQILLSFFKFYLYFIDAINNFYEKIFQINKNNKKCFTFWIIIKIEKFIIEKFIIEKINFQNYTIWNEFFYKNDNLWIFEN